MRGNHVRHVSYGEGPKALCILVPELQAEPIRRTYVEPYGVTPGLVMAVELPKAPGKKKLTAAELREWFTGELAPILAEQGTQYLVVGDGEAFKTIAKTTKAEPYLGYLLPTDLAPVQVAYAPNYRQMLYDPQKIGAKVALALNAVKASVKGEYRDPGCAIIESAYYPTTVDAILATIERLHERPALAVDIEGFGLKHYEAGIGTIGFAWNQGNGVAFPVDLLPPTGPEQIPYRDIGRIREALRRFFETYRGKLVWHNAGYDVTVKIFQLFMDHLLDNEGLLRGLEAFTSRDWDDTKLISYLATNSTSGNDNSLKAQAQEFAGNYAIDVIDILAHPLKDVLQYNLIDCLSTWYVYDKHVATLDRDQQREVYGLFKGFLTDIIQMQLTGMPVSMDQVGVVRQVLQAALDGALERIRFNRNVLGFESLLRDEWVETKNAGYKTITLKDGTVKRKVVSLADCPAEIGFNPNSGPQMQRLLFEMIGLPVLGTTKTGQPETGGDVLKDLRNHTRDGSVLELLEALVEYAAVDKILGTFIPALETAQKGPDGWHWLFGSFNLGGTVSGRLSSSNPNLQNLPANVAMTPSPALLALYGEMLADFMEDGRLLLGKLVKSCFQAPPGWFFTGIDFDSLEDKISALTTKDPNKLKVYSGLLVYELDIDGTIHHIREDATVVYDGRSYTGAEFYAAFGEV
jgi:DNA polymerase-1